MVATFVERRPLIRNVNDYMKETTSFCDVQGRLLRKRTEYVSRWSSVNGYRFETYIHII